MDRFTHVEINGNQIDATTPQGKQVSIVVNEDWINLRVTKNRGRKLVVRGSNEIEVQIAIEKEAGSGS